MCKYLTVVLALLVCVGCTNTRLTKGDIAFKRLTFASDHTIKRMIVTSTTNGTFTVTLEGYLSDSETKEITEGAVSALKIL